MPIYEYQCDACGHKFEIMQKMRDDPLSDCPHCDQTKLRKLVSAAGFRLKGGGWYETDFKSGQKKNISSADKKETTKKASSSTKGHSCASGGCGCN